MLREICRMLSCIAFCPQTSKCFVLHTIPWLEYFAAKLLKVPNYWLWTAVQSEVLYWIEREKKKIASSVNDIETDMSIKKNCLVFALLVIIQTIWILFVIWMDCARAKNAFEQSNLLSDSDKNQVNSTLAFEFIKICLY